MGTRYTLRVPIRLGVKCSEDQTYAPITGGEESHCSRTETDSDIHSAQIRQSPPGRFTVLRIGFLLPRIDRSASQNIDLSLQSFTIKDLLICIIASLNHPRLPVSSAPSLEPCAKHSLNSSRMSAVRPSAPLSTLPRAGMHGHHGDLLSAPLEDGLRFLSPRGRV